jgi:hypothetical protein
MIGFHLLKAFLLKRATPKPYWERVFDPEYSRVRDAILAQARSGVLHLEIARHGPDQYSVFYERTFQRDKPLSVQLDSWDEALMKPESR